MRMIWVLSISLLFAGQCLADEDEDAKEAKAAEKEAVEEVAEERKLTGAEKRALEEEVVAGMVDSYNEGVETDLDEVVCTKEAVTGSRRKIRICKTRREIAEEQAAAQRALSMRSRSSSMPAASQGVGAN